jgi:hypothetical protein
MANETPHEELERLRQEVDLFIKEMATKHSAARILAENEGIGDLVVLSMCDDAVVNNDLWAYFQMIANFLKETEARYQAQFPGDWPRIDGRFDLSKKPAGFKARLEIFQEIVEASESGALWSTEVMFHDPLAVVKRFKHED